MLLNMKRIDILIYEKGLARSRTHAAAIIDQGRVTVNGAVVKKSSEKISEEAEIKILKSERDFVSRAGHKLYAALAEFSIDVSEYTAVDIGASTGGFTDCLLQSGAKKVYAVDVGRNQLCKMLADDYRVVRMEGINARYLGKKDFQDEPDIIVADVSFISQTLIYDAVSNILPGGMPFISLIKPQFELDRSCIGKNGIVTDRDGSFYKRITDNIREQARIRNLILNGVIPSPVEGSDGNKEYLAYFTKGMGF